MDQFVVRMRKRAKVSRDEPQTGAGESASAAAAAVGAVVAPSGPGSASAPAVTTVRFETADVPGLRLAFDFLSPEEEQRCLQEVDAGTWDTSLKRRVQHYGRTYQYNERNLSDAPAPPLPVWSEFLVERLLTSGVLSERPTQMIVNEYLPGQGISAHVDQPRIFGPTVVSVCLGSGCELVLAPCRQGRAAGEVVSAAAAAAVTPRATGDARPEPAQVKLYLPRRCAFVLQGPARYDWTHCIPARKSDVVKGVSVPRTRRVSLTFRTVAAPP